MSAPGDDRATSALIGDILHSLTALLRKEIDLARSETSESLQRAAVAVVLVLGAVILALSGLNVLAAAAVAGLVSAGLAAGWASLAVGGAFALFALGLALKAIHNFKTISLAPRRITQNLKRDVATFREAIND